MKKIFTIWIVLAAVAAKAGVPIKWTVETSRADTQEIELFHGETLDLEVQFKSYGKVLELPTNEIAMTYWQTNGMGTAYWRTNNVTIVASNGIMRSSFGSAMDVGAKTLRGFMGIAGNIYRASFVLRFKDAPGYDTVFVEWPYRELDFNLVEMKNEPWYRMEQTYSRGEVTAILAAYDKYVNATNREEEVISNLTSWARGEFRTITDSYTKSQIDSFIKLLETKANAITATNTLDQTIRDWAEEEFQKSWELEEVELGKDASATGTKTTAIGAYSAASGISSIALGNAAEAKGTYPIAVGLYAKATNGNAVAMGSYADAVNGGVNIGVGGQWSHGYARANGVAIGSIAKAEQMGIAIGQGAEAGNQSIAIGRDAKATHTAAVAIGATAETTADSTMRIKYSPSEIFIGFWTAKSLQDYFDEIEPDIDFVGITNLVKNAPFLPMTVKGKYYGSTVNLGGWNISSNATALTSLWEFKGAGSAKPTMKIGSGATLQVGYGAMDVSSSGTAYLRNPSRVYVGADGTTNLTDFVKANSVTTESDPTVQSWAKAASKPTYTAEEVGAYPNASGQTLATQVGTIGGYLNAEDARFVSTNYNSATKMPEAYVEVKQTDATTGSNVWLMVWREMTRWNKWTGSEFDWTNWNGFYGWKTNIEHAVSERSPREYAFYDGVTGEAAPDGFFWVSQPRIAICAGAGYQRYVSGSSEVWVLESNGMVANINGTTNGYFRITDESGDVQFEIIKGDKTTVFANSLAVWNESVMGVTHWHTTYAVTNAVAPPTARFKTALTNETWIAESSSDCPCNVEWTAGVNSYEIEWWPKTTAPTMFLTADYQRGGDTIIRNNAPVAMETVYIGGIKYAIGVTTNNNVIIPKLTVVQ